MTDIKIAREAEGWGGLGKPGFDAALSEAQSVLRSLERINGNIPSAGFIAFWLGVVPLAGFLAILISF